MNSDLVMFICAASSFSFTGMLAWVFINHAIIKKETSTSKKCQYRLLGIAAWFMINILFLMKLTDTIYLN